MHPAANGFTLLCVHAPRSQVGGSGGIQSLWMRSTPSEGGSSPPDATQAGLQAQWRQLNNLNGTAAWELRCGCVCCSGMCMVHGLACTAAYGC